MEPVEDDFDIKAYLPEKWYKFLRGLAMPILPALATLVLVIGAQWDIAGNRKIAETITAVAAFLGILVQVSSSRYQKATNVGDVVVHQKEEGGLLYSLDLSVPVEHLEKVDTVTFNVKR